jgi:hypothetical protein
MPNIISSFDSIVYILSHAIKMQLFWPLVKANDVLPCVPIFNYLIIIILKQSRTFNSHDLYYDMWSNVNMPHDI